MSICWQCSEIFKLDDDAIEEDMPKCFDCRFGLAKSTLKFDFTLDDKMQINAAMRKAGVERLDEMNPQDISQSQLLGLLPNNNVLNAYREFQNRTHAPINPKAIEKDEIEVIEPSDDEGDE